MPLLSTAFGLFIGGQFLLLEESGVPGENKRPFKNRKSDNPSQLRLESNAPARAGSNSQPQC